MSPEALTQLSGNHPVLLDDARWIYKVEAGQVDVFAVHAKDGAPAGPRRHVFTAFQGGIFTGAPAHDGFSLLAVGRLGAAVRRETAQDFAKGADASEDFKLYLQTVADALSPTGSADVKVEEKDATLESVRILQDSLMDKLSRLIEKDEAEDAERLKRRQAADERAYRGALTRLASIIEPQARLAPTQEGDALFSALLAVGEASGIEFVHPAGGASYPSPRFYVDAVCQASRVRSRRVALRGDWWKSDCGPILASLVDPAKEEPAPATDAVPGPGASPEQDFLGAPVALLPVKPGVYEIFNPADGSRRRLEAGIARSVSTFGYVFYRPFPDAVVRFKDVAGFALRDVRGDLLMLAAMAAAGAVLGLAAPWVTGKLFDSVIPNTEYGALFQYTLALVAAAAATAFFGLTQGVAMMRVNGKYNGEVQAALWDRLLRLPVPFFRDYSVGELAERANAVNSIQQILSGTVMTTVLNSLHAALNLFLLFYYDASLALYACGLLAATVAVYSACLWMSLRLRYKLTALDNKISGLVFQLLGGLSKLRVAAAERRGFAVWSKSYAESTRLTFAANTYDNLIQVFNAMIPVFASAAIFWMVHVKMHPTGNAAPLNLSIGEFVAFMAAFTVFLNAGISLSGTAFSILNVVPIWKNAKPIMETLPEADSSKPASKPLSGRVEVNHLSFRYRPDGPKILDDVSFRVEPGEFVALVGPSGSGKSTILRLLLGFETPEIGSIYYDGQDISKVDAGSIRRQIGVVLQNGRLLAGDVYRNIVGSLPLSVEDAWAAAELAGVAQDIRDMPMGMFTLISEGASTLSGGQRQRLLIARALARRPKKIYFDEATSALDNTTQEVVTKSLNALHVTRVVIAHRLSTIRNADRVIVLDKGRVVQEGIFDELAGAPGLFKALISRQVS